MCHAALFGIYKEKSNDSMHQSLSLLLQRNPNVVNKRKNTKHLHGLNTLHQRHIAGCDTHTHMGRSSKKLLR